MGCVGGGGGGGDDAVDDDDEAEAEAAAWAAEEGRRAQTWAAARSAADLALGRAGRRRDEAGAAAVLSEAAQRGDRDAMVRSVGRSGATATPWSGPERDTGPGERGGKRRPGRDWVKMEGRQAHSQPPLQSAPPTPLPLHNLLFQKAATTI